jgi:prevent-host-death family protein
MSKLRHRGAEDARNQLPELLAAAEKGQSTVITKHGRPIAALIPIEEFPSIGAQLSLIALKGTGSGLWGTDSVETIRRLREEWNR